MYLVHLINLVIGKAPFNVFSLSDIISGCNFQSMYLYLMYLIWMSSSKHPSGLMLYLIHLVIMIYIYTTGNGILI